MKCPNCESTNIHKSISSGYDGYRCDDCHVWMYDSVVHKFNNDSDKILMPKALTAENGAKALMMGEFFETIQQDCPECYGDGCSDCDDNGYFEIKIPIKWTIIKEIYKMAVDNLGVEL